MDPLRWALYLAAAGLALAAVLYLYRRREAPGRGRTLLAGLRFGAIALLLLLLFDPELPSAGLAAGARRVQVLLDGSLSMAAPAGAARDTGDGGGGASAPAGPPQRAVDRARAPTRWDAAVAEARRLARGGDVIVFGDAARAVAADSLPGLEPAAPASRLLPALQAASEAGARRVVVLTDGGIEDAAEVARALPRLGLDLEVRPVEGAGALRNRGLAELDAPGWAEAGKETEVRVGVAALAGQGDSVAVVLRRDGRVLARQALELPAPGRVATAALAFTPEPPAGSPEGGGLVRYDLALEPEDAVPDDDRRSFYVHVSDRPAGVALVSFRPDWEPRFLQPVLEQALGVPVRGYLRLANGAYVTAGPGTDAGRRAAEDAVRRAVATADLVVLHGLGEASPGWAREAAANARRVLVFPDGADPALGLPVRLAPPAPGDWYPAAETPASPVAALVGALPADQLPPLTGVRPVEPPPGAWAAIEATRGLRGAPSPLVLAGETGGRRWAVALADGFWGWAFRGGEPRQAYRRLWASLGGWLTREERSVAAAAVRPVERAVPRGAPIRFLAPGLAADSIALTVEDAEGRTVLDTTIAAVRGDSVTAPALPPGHYTYSARAFAAGQEAAAARGPLTVESHSPEFSRAAVSLASFRAEAGEAGGAAPRRAGGPLHASAWPYLLLVLLLSAEWVLRRRWGLR